MGFSIFDYVFKSDAFEFNYRLLVLNGLWPIHTKNKLYKYLYSIYSFLCLFSPISMLFIQILDLYLLRNNPVRFTKNICSTSVTYASVVKQILISYKVENVEKLQHHLTEFKNSRLDPEEMKIFEQATKKMAKVTKAVYSLAIPCVTAWILYPGLESSSQKEVPFPYRLPTDDWSTPIYELLYTYHSISMIGFMVMVLSIDLVYYGLVIQINAMYEILIKKLNRLEAFTDYNLKGSGRSSKLYDSTATEGAKLAVKECCVLHQAILEEIDELKIIYGTPYLIHFSAAVILVGAIIIDVVVVSKGFQLHILQRIMYSANGLWDTFLCCYFTTEMQEKSYELAEAVYSSPWYELSPEIRKDLLLISVRSKTAPAVRVGNYFPLNLTTFLQFLKLTYNITALLYQTMKK